MSSTQTNDKPPIPESEEAAYSPTGPLIQSYAEHHQLHMHSRQEQQSHSFHAYQARQAFSSESRERKLYAIEEQQEGELEKSENRQVEGVDIAYDADVDDDGPVQSTAASLVIASEQGGEGVVPSQKNFDDKEHIYELFQPWALKTYGDLAKTKTITMRKKVRILKALEGKEHSRPDSSKFRFWVKTKGFTTKRPESFEDAPCTQRHKKSLPPNAVLSENPADVDLYVASTTKDLEKRTYRKVAVVEEFFDIIFQIHMELGGRSGMHAGQKRTYRIISETYAFLPREAVTRFLSICPECKKNLRPSSPSAHNLKDDLGAAQNESSSEVEVLNYSSHTESSLEAGPTTKLSTKSTLHTPGGTGALHSISVQPKKRRYSHPDNNSKAFVCPTEQVAEHSLPRRNSSPLVAQATAPKPLSFGQAHIPKIRINPNLQRPSTPPVTTEAHPFVTPYQSYGFDFHSLKSQDSLMRYYDFMRRLYAGNLPMPHAVLPPPSSQKESLPYPHKSKLAHLPALGKKSALNVHEPSISSSSEDEADNSSVVKAKRFKSSEKTKALESLPMSLLIPTIDKDFVQSTQIRAINLSKNSSHFSVQGRPSVDDCAKKTAATPTHKPPPPQSEIQATSTPSSVKQEPLTPPKSSALPALRIPQLRTISSLPPLDYERLKPITSTYLQLTRSMGLSDEEALRFDNLEAIPPATTTDTTNSSETNTEADPYAGIMKDADKLKLMLLAWNYQNSNAARNGADGPDLSIVGGLWAQYQSALAQNAAASNTKLDASLSPVPREGNPSPMEAQDETNSSGQKEEDEGSEDDSDDKIDEKLAYSHDPERLKAFNMFVRLFVDENLDRIVPISKQPKEKIQAIIDSCARQFPEFSDRSRKRIRTYLKSCRRNKKTRDGWENTTRPTPAHLTSVQAEQILAIACENESLNAKRMRIGLEPITHAIPAPGSAVAAAAALLHNNNINNNIAAATTSSAASVGGASTSSTVTSASANDGSNAANAAALPFATCTGFARSTPNSDVPEPLSLAPAVSVAAAVASSSAGSGGMNSARSSPLALSSNASITGMDIKPLTTAALSNGNTANNAAATLTGLPATSPLYRPTDFTSPTTASPFVAAAAAAVAGRTQTYPTYFPGVTSLGNVTPTDLSMKPSCSSAITSNTPSTTVNVNNQGTNNSGSGISSLATLNQLNVNTNLNNGNVANTNALATATHQLQQLQQVQQQQQTQDQQQQQQQGLNVVNANNGMDANAVRPPLLPHKLSPNEITAARQVISAYRESAAFLLRTADQVEQLLVQQQ
ncbi:uncharacterized protein LOC106082858 isoform X1 [Stomoxys calcitrans]|uniref:uncharacterized protein LOC106082858 isoform X1 n=1 Tax=Stomoxys calcitrans TaxID=35570 RepID=UPI0027E2A4C7|nr:uncharacterized protein LOC106082858 isoform X1 [Stomoxys calcitrans]